MFSLPSRWMLVNISNCRLLSSTPHPSHGCCLTKPRLHTPTSKSASMAGVFVHATVAVSVLHVSDIPAPATMQHLLCSQKHCILGNNNAWFYHIDLVYKQWCHYMNLSVTKHVDQLILIVAQWLVHFYFPSVYMDSWFLSKFIKYLYYRNICTFLISSLNLHVFLNMTTNDLIFSQNLHVFLMWPQMFCVFVDTREDL